MWSGDNYADFSFLKSSISDMIISQMTGMTMSGADICGFGGNTTV
jgi:alpha-glucosidase